MDRLVRVKVMFLEEDGMGSEKKNVFPYFRGQGFRKGLNKRRKFNDEAS